MNPYDRVPYPEMTFPESHPDHLAVLAGLLGLSPAPVERCRVLEFGCASGGNLIPMAHQFPGAQFVGIDYSERQIEQGQATIRALGLDNIRLEHRNILEFEEQGEAFDYIIAHGVYSWVPWEVRDRMLHLCRARLVPNGVAFVSYNTLPGWYLVNVSRDAMRYRTRTIEDPAARAPVGRAFVKFLSEIVLTAQGSSYFERFSAAYRTLLESQALALSGRGDVAVSHDEFEEVNEPLYFHQFVEHADSHGLQFLVEANFPATTPDRMPKEVMDHIWELAGSIVEVEQYMDFVRGRTFRQSLLVHQEIPIDYALNPDRVHTLFVSSRARVTVPEAGASPGELAFAGADGATFATAIPLVHTAMRILIDRAPGRLHFTDLLRKVAAALPAAGEEHMAEETAKALATGLLQLFRSSRQLIEFHTTPATYVTSLSNQPVASSLARHQAMRSPMVTTLQHTQVQLDVLQAFLLVQLDGTDDLAMLERKTAVALKRQLAPSAPGHSATAGQPVTAEETRAALQDLARMGLLVA